MASAASILSNEQRVLLTNCIQKAEGNTSGEIRLHIDNHCKGDAMDAAKFWFYKLDMDKTKLQNGILLYIAIKDKKVAIVGDKGINNLVENNYWDSIIQLLSKSFSLNNYYEGLHTAITSIGYELKKFFPLLDDDKNELSNEITYGE
jgi:uncharacterized membrane protein